MEITAFTEKPTEDLERRARNILQFLVNKRTWLSAKDINKHFGYVHSTLWKTLKRKPTPPALSGGNQSGGSRQRKQRPVNTRGSPLREQHRLRGRGPMPPRRAVRTCRRIRHR